MNKTVWRCPNCNSRDVGKIGQEHYFCSRCCVEFTRRRDCLKLFTVSDDGTLIALTAE